MQRDYIISDGTYPESYCTQPLSLHVVTGGGEIGLKNDLSCTQILCTMFLSEMLKDQHFAEEIPLKKR